MSSLRTLPGWRAAILIGAVASGGCPELVAPGTDAGSDPAKRHCTDLRQDEDETDVDCGGSCGSTCVYGQHCGSGRDCAVGECALGICTPRGSTCSDHARDGSETDVDCGGECPLCGDGKRCAIDGDCASRACAMGACQVGTPPFSFAEARFASVAGGPAALAAGDFNRDGKLDLACAASGDNQVSVLLGRGDGTFDRPRALDVGRSPQDIVAADLDGDGTLDLATADQGGNDVSILLGQGDGNFLAAPTGALTVNGPGALVAIDANRDGRVDLAVLDAQGGLAVLLGGGAGAFTVQPQAPVGSSSAVLSTGDFDGDGAADLAYVTAYSAATMLNAGGGSFGAPRTIAGIGTIWYVVAGDLDLDGHLDLVDASYNGYACTIKGDAAGAFAPPVCRNLGGAPWSARIADLDGDGRPDVALLNEGTGNISLLRGRGDGTVDNAINVFVGGSPQSLITGDFNNDGKVDLAICDYFTHDVGVLLNTHP